MNNLFISQNIYKDTPPPSYGSLIITIPQLGSWTANNIVSVQTTDNTDIGDFSITNTYTITFQDIGKYLSYDTVELFINVTISSSLTKRNVVLEYTLDYGGIVTILSGVDYDLSGTYLYSLYSGKLIFDINNYYTLHDVMGINAWNEIYTDDTIKTSMGLTITTTTGSKTFYPTIINSGKYLQYQIDNINSRPLPFPLAKIAIRDDWNPMQNDMIYTGSVSDYALAEDIALYGGSLSVPSEQNDLIVTKYMYR